MKKIQTLILISVAVFGLTAHALDPMPIEDVCPTDMQDRQACVDQYHAEFSELMQRHSEEIRQNFPSTQNTIQPIESETGGLTAKPVQLIAETPSTPPVLHLQNMNAVPTSVTGSTSTNSNGQNPGIKEKGFFGRLFDKLFGWLKK